MLCPISRNAPHADSSAASVSSSGDPSALWLMTASRSFFGCAVTSSTNGRVCGRAAYGSPGIIPAIASSISAASRTVRAIGPFVESPAHPSPAAGDDVIRPRDGLIPTSPQHAAGIRTEPPPSLPCATGCIPAATADADPPLEPPAVCSRFHGFRAGGHSPPSVTGRNPNSGVEVLPSRIPPEFASRTASSASAGACQFSKFFEPKVVRISFVQSRSLSEYATPNSGSLTPSAALIFSSRAASASARSAVTVMNAPSFGFKLLDARKKKFSNLARPNFLLEHQLAQFPCFDVRIKHRGHLQPRKFYRAIRFLSLAHRV